MSVLSPKSDDRPSKVPKITAGPITKRESTLLPYPLAVRRSSSLGSEFDSKCLKIDALDEHKDRIREWTIFFASTPVNSENFYDARRYLQEFMFQFDRKTAEKRLRQCEILEPLQKAVIEQYGNLICISDTRRKYLNNMFEILNKQCDGCDGSSVAVYTTVLFDRLAVTFDTLQDMQGWFDTHKISSAALQAAEAYGVRCILFAMCGYLAAKNLDDETLDELLLEMFKSIVFYQPRSTVVDQLHSDILILELAVLDRLKWKTHVSVDSYAERVKDMPGMPEKEKEKILEMFAENDKLHWAEFGDHSS